MAETQQQEIVRVIKAAGRPMTRPEIFDKCKQVADMRNLSVTLSTMVGTDLLAKVGEQPRDKGMALALYDLGTVQPGERRPPGAAKKKPAVRKGGGKPKAKPKVGKKAKLKRSKRPSGDVPLNNLEPLEVSGFRCGLYNDGSLAINAADGQITLSAGELKLMRDFVSRMTLEW